MIKILKSLALLVLSVATLNCTLFKFAEARSESENCAVRLHSNDKKTQPELDKQIEKIRKEIPNVHSMIQIFESVIDNRLAQAFVIKSKSNIKISSNPNDYQNANFIVGLPNLNSNNQVIQNIEFGYLTRDRFQFIAKIEAIEIDSNGKIINVFSKTSEVMSELKAHLFGREFSQKERLSIQNINKLIFKELSENQNAKLKLTEFAKSRKWPEGIVESGKLIYFSEEILDLKNWAKQNGFTFQQMKDAGWFRKSFSSIGKPIYRVSGSNTIKIPYFEDAEQTQINLWRTRTLDKTNPDLPKYLSWPLDRSWDRKFAVNDLLYNGWKLNKAKNKTVIVTEGEFKCMVAEKMSDFIVVGLPGITQFDDVILNALLRSEAKEIIIILDRDPIAKGMQRVDGVSDSERAAYSIGKQIKDAGYKNVRVGLLPDAFNGEKVGIDDLILAKGVEPFLQTVRNAMSVEKYADVVGIDKSFQDILITRQKLSKTLRQYESNIKRGGSQVDENILLQARKKLDDLISLERLILSQKYNQARNILQNDYKYTSIGSKLGFQSKNGVFDSNGELYQSQIFDEEILYLSYAPKEIDPNLCKPSPCLPMQISSDEVEQKFVNEILQPIFPEDEYQYLFNSRTNAKNSIEIPIIILKKKNNKAVAFITLPYPHKENAKQIINNQISSFTQKQFDSIYKSIRE